MGYLANFMVYTLAMIGVIAIALLVFKNSSGFGGCAKSKHLKVLDSLSLAPRKTLYVVSTGREKFLIAGDVSHTTLISKLDTNEAAVSFPMERVSEGQEEVSTSFQETMASLPKSRYMDRMNLGIKSSQNSPYSSVMKSLASKIR